MADRFALLQVGALHLERAFLTTQGTGSSAVGTGLLFAQSVGLLFEEGLQSARGETGGGSVGDLLHGIEIDVESRPVVPEGASGDDFAPACGEVVEFLKFLGSERASCHAASYLGVATKTREKMVPDKVLRELHRAKRFMTSTETVPSTT